MVRFICGGGHADKDNNRPKLERFKERLGKFALPGARVLEIGPGEAWAMDYFLQQGSEYYAIEPVPKLSDNIVARGGRVIGAGIYEESVSSSYQGFFDLVVLRHVAEHLLDPGRAIKIVRSLLAPSGNAYIAVPNTASVTEESARKKGFRTSYIRPVHVSYFTEATLWRLAARGGLALVEGAADWEVYGVFRRLDDQEAWSIPENCYEAQKNRFISISIQMFVSDMWRILRDFPRGAIRRLIVNAD